MDANPKTTPPLPATPLDLGPVVQGWAMDQRMKGRTWHWYQFNGAALCRRPRFMGPLLAYLPRGARPCLQCKQSLKEMRA